MLMEYERHTFHDISTVGNVLILDKTRYDERQHWLPFINAILANPRDMRQHPTSEEIDEQKRADRRQAYHAKKNANKVVPGFKEYAPNSREWDKVRGEYVTKPEVFFNYETDQYHLPFRELRCVNEAVGRKTEVNTLCKTGWVGWENGDELYFKHNADKETIREWCDRTSVGRYYLVYLSEDRVQVRFQKRSDATLFKTRFYEGK